MGVGCRVLLISGSLRGGSTNTALLRTAESSAPPGVVAVLYPGMGSLPHFNPDHDRAPLDPAVSELRSAIREADALLFSTPEYAGALPGSFKNLLDWTVGDDRAGSIYEKPVAWINVSTAPGGAADAHESLRKVLGYVGASVVEAACAHLPVRRGAVGTDGLVSEVAVVEGVIEALNLLADRWDGGR